MDLGAHVSTAGGIDKALERGVELGADVVQIFTQSPRQWTPKPQSDEALAAYAAKQSASSIRATFCHASYLINLATDDEALFERSFDCLVANLTAATMLGSAGVVLHVGSHGGRGFDSVRQSVADALTRALDTTASALSRPSCRLLLENAAGTGGTVGRSLDELAEIIETALFDERLGMCLDTQHLHASGVSFETTEETDAVVALIESSVSLSRLGLIHLNDSKVAFGANRDRHENLGEGSIGRVALGLLLSHPSIDHVPAALEVPGDGQGPRKSDVEDAREILSLGYSMRA